MPELQLNYAQEPPWLRNDAQPSTFLDDIGKSLLIEQRRKEIPLKLQEMQQENRMRELKQEEFLRQREDLIKAEELLQEMAPQVSSLLDQNKPEEALNYLGSMVAKKPIIGNSPQFNTLLKGAQISARVKTARERSANYLEAARLRARPGQHLTALESDTQSLTAAKEAVDSAELELKAAVASEDEESIALAEQGLKHANTVLESYQAKMGRRGGLGYAPSNTERVIDEAEKRGIKFSQEDLDEAFKVAAGVQPKERSAISEADFISKNLEPALAAEAANPTGPKGGGIMGYFQSATPKSRDAVIEELRGLYRTIYKKHSPAAEQPSAAVMDAPSDPSTRTPNTVYSTPKGPLKWTGTGWVTP